MLLYTQTIEDPRQAQLFEDVYTAWPGPSAGAGPPEALRRRGGRGRVHQAFLALAEHFQRLCRLPRPQLEAYLVVVTERKCIDCLRQQAARDGVPFDENTVLVTPPPCGDPVADAMGRLPPRSREALLLRYGCGYSTRETASLLELSFAAAQKLLQRAKAALRTELEKEGISV